MELKWPDIALAKRHPRATIALFILFFLFVAWFVEEGEAPAPQNSAIESEESLDTFIPRGFVLVPIEIQNLASVDSILGQFGVVDLYTEGEAQAIGVGLKLIRSPRDPSQFAVLSPEEDSRELVRHSAKPFQIVVQNRDRAQSVVRTVQKTKARIQWEEE